MAKKQKKTQANPVPDLWRYGDELYESKDDADRACGSCVKKFLSGFRQGVKNLFGVKPNDRYLEPGKLLSRLLDDQSGNPEACAALYQLFSLLCQNNPLAVLFDRNFPNSSPTPAFVHACSGKEKKSGRGKRTEKSA